MSDNTHTAELTHVYNAQNPQSTLLSVNVSNITRLTDVNYVMWSRQIRALLEGHELHGFLDSSVPSPTETLLVDGKVTANPAFAPWKRQDRLLYSAIIGSISLAVQPVVSSAVTTADVWNLLAATYGKPSRGHIKQLKHHVKTCEKGTKTIAEYLRLIKSKADELSLLGNPLDHEDLIDQVLSGLPEEYKSVVDAINARDQPIAFVELHERLINKEAMLLCGETSSMVTGPVTVNIADARSSRSYNNSGKFSGRSSHQRSYTQQQQFQPRGRTPRPYLGRCQACGIQGHSAKYCPDFKIVRGSSQVPTLPPMQQQQHNYWNQSQPYHYLPSAPSQWTPRANMAVTNGDTSTWLLDSGASHHMTSDIANLSLHSPYNGGEEVLLGDGSGLQITQTGTRSDYGGSSSSRNT